VPPRRAPTSRLAHQDSSPRDPQQTTLHRVVREYLETFLARRAEEGEPMPSFVVDELRGYLGVECSRSGPCASRAGTAGAIAS
jgi:hypothetical protein